MLEFIIRVYILDGKVYYQHQDKEPVLVKNFSSVVEDMDGVEYEDKVTYV